MDCTDVVIVGAGPTGLTLACDLARRGVKVRVLEKSMTPFQGSRGKGIQPRTIEVFDDLGAAPALLRAGSQYPPMKLHLPVLALKWHMIKPHPPTPDVPFASTWLVPQWRTEEVLRNRLAELGHQVEWDNAVTDIRQDGDGVTVHVQSNGQLRTLWARYAVGADGGRSFVRKSLGLKLIGSTSQEGRMIVGDVRVDGLSRDSWHVWLTRRGAIGLCPLPHSDLFQLMMKLDSSEPEPELSEQTIQARWFKATGSRKIRLRDPTWLSVFRPNVRLVERYRVGRVFLAGDAAHVHTPAGAQGLNTGVQDAYNLGWKLALALKGAPDALLDTYEEERLPVAASVLELSSELFQTVRGRSLPKLTRGDKERQLLLNYRESSLTQRQNDGFRGKVQPGDRAPDAPCSQQRSGTVTLFDVFRGGHFTVLAFGDAAIDAVRELRESKTGPVRAYAIRPAHASGDVETLADEGGHACCAYGVTARDNVIFVVRPDGYIGRIARSDWRQAMEAYLAAVAGPALTPGRMPAEAAAQ